MTISVIKTAINMVLFKKTIYETGIKLYEIIEMGSALIKEGSLSRFGSDFISRYLFLDLV